MFEFRYLYGTVYIFENAKAQCVKVGVTVNDVFLRLRDINNMWLDQKVTCQICGGRRLAIGMFIHRHVVSGKECPGGYALPLEKDVRLAESHLENVKSCLGNLSSSEKASATRIVNNLQKRIEKYRHYNGPVGEWRFRVAFNTKRAEEVELLSHKILEQYLDMQAPFGEVFCCSVSVATDAVETVLGELGLLHLVRKETQS